MGKRVTRRRAASSQKARGEKHRRWLKSAVATAIVALAAFLIYRTLSNYSLEEITRSIKAIPPGRLLLAGVFAAGSYFCLSWFDWLALRYVGKPLPYRRAVLASFCSLSLGHNIGFAALSSGAIRYRFYARWGLSLGEIAKVILFCAITVGLGLISLGGLALLLRPDLAVKVTGFGRLWTTAIGIVFVTVPVAYAFASVFLRGRITIRGTPFQLPEPKLALAQIGIGVANFACVAACLHQTLSAVGNVAYLEVAAVYVIANGTALLAHVPGGLGVIESVVLLLLPGSGVIGALVMFRVIYFLIPLCIGAPLFGLTELYFRARKQR